MVNRALQGLAIDPVQTVMFGDHHVDLRAARAAGTANCFCGWGLGHDAGLESDFRAERTADLFAIFPGSDQ